MIEIVDGVLEFLEDRLLAGAFARDVGNPPSGERPPASATGIERPCGDAIPAGAADASRGRIERTRHADFFIRADAIAKFLGDPVNGFGRIGVAGEGPVDRMDLPLRRGADEVRVRAVGVGDAPVAVGDDDALAHRIDESAAERVVLAASRETDQPDGGPQEGRHADDGKDAEEPDDEGLGPARREQGKADRDADKTTGKHDQPPGARDPIGPVDHRLDSNGRGGAIAHLWPLLPQGCPNRRTARGESNRSIDLATMGGID